MSKGALSLALLLGTVNASCARAVQPPATPVAEPASSPDAPPQVWRSKASRRFTGSLVLAGETIYGGGLDRKVVAVDLASGQQRWTSRLGGIIGGGVVVGGDTVYAATTRPEGKVSAIDGTTGQRVWRTTTGPVNAPLALIGGLVIAQSQHGDIFALDGDRGDSRFVVPGQRGRRQGAAAGGLSRRRAVTVGPAREPARRRDQRLARGRRRPG
jgi:outer membrane protein assembly factor BamB